MKKIFYILILFVFLTSCEFDDVILTTNEERNSNFTYSEYIVNKIEKTKYDGSTYRCSSNTLYFSRKNTFNFAGKNGEFAIGDTIYITISKK